MPLWKPAVYQGPRRATQHYEDLCYKLLDAAGRTLLLKPGCVVDGESGELRGTLGVETEAGGRRLTFPADAFDYSRRSWRLRLGDCLFSDRRLELKLERKEIELSGLVRIHGGRGWPVRLFEPGALGRTALVPWIRSRFQVLNFDGPLSGSLRLDGTGFDFTDGRVYVEKSWGSESPTAWLRLQCNHFPGGGVCLVALLAELEGPHRGFVVGLWHRGELHRFSSFSGARPLRIEATKRGLSLRLEDRTRGLELELRRGAPAVEIAAAPVTSPGAVTDELGGRVRVRLYRRAARGDHSEYEAEGRHAVYSRGGRIGRLIEELGP